MSDQLSMFSRPTCADSRSATSSLASEDGLTPCVSPDGLTTDPSGPAPAPANPSAQQGRGKGSGIPVISGRRGFGSSESAALQWSLESRLRAKMASHGSTLYRLTWKKRVTPSGRRIFALRASARRTSGNDSSLLVGWPTPNAGPQNDTDSTWQQRREQLKAEHKNGNGFGMTLGMAATLSGWPTATVHDAERGGQAKRAAGETRHGSNLQDFAQLTGWATPAQLSGWTTPQAHDSHPRSENNRNNSKAGNACLAWDARSTSGPTSSGSPAQTANTGQLNPAFSLWLMGYPDEWVSCGARAMRSFQISQRRSSKRAKASEFATEITQQPSEVTA
jgi:hypothetical protein